MAGPQTVFRVLGRPGFHGIASLICLDVSLNFLLLKQALFIPSVLIPFAAGLGFALLWVIMSLTRLAEEAAAGRSARRLNAVVGSVVFFGICVALYAFARHFDVSWDLTQEGRRDLSPQTMQILEGLTAEVEVYGLFITAGDSLSNVTADRTLRFLERCRQLCPSIKAEIVDPEREPLILKRLSLEKERIPAQGAIVIRSGTRQRMISLSGPNPRLQERDFVNTLLTVTRAAQPKVYFLTGHGETSFEEGDDRKGATLLAQWLTKEAYQLATLAISPSRVEVPLDCDVLVMNGQTADLAPYEIIAFQNYIERGGRLLVLMDFWFVEERGSDRVKEQLRPWLEERFGIRVGEDLVLTADIKTDMMLFPNFSLLGMQAQRRGSFNEDHAITRSFDQNMMLTGARSVAVAEKLPEGVTASELLYTLPNCWAETNLSDLFKQGSASRPTRSPDEREGSIPIAAAAAMKTKTPIGDSGQTRDARVVVVGNRDFASNDRLRVLGNINFVMNTFAWLTENEELIAIRAVEKSDPPIILSPAQEQAVAWIASLGLLHLIVLAGIASHIWRRRHQ